MKKVIWSILSVFLSLTIMPACSCTVFTFRSGDITYFGNNEDYLYNNTYIAFTPSNGTTFGMATLGYHNNNGFIGDNAVQGGFNAEGLAIDGMSLPPMPLNDHSTDRPTAPSGDPSGNILMFCKNVTEAVKWILKYNFNISEIAGQIHIADKYGNATVASVNNGEWTFTFINEEGYLVSTNYNIANKTIGEWPSARQYVAETMLDNFTHFNVSENDLMSVLNATCQKRPSFSSPSHTVYSYLINLNTLDIAVYYLHDFSKNHTFNLETELQKGAHIYDLGNLFATNKNIISGYECFSVLFIVGIIVLNKKHIIN